MHDPYFRVRLVSDHVSPYPSSQVVFVNPERSSDELKAVYRTHEYNSALPFVGILGGLLTVFAFLGVVLGFAGAMAIAVAFGGLAMAIIAALLPGRFKYSAGKDYYTSELSPGVDRELHELEKLAQDGWLHPNEERVIAGLLVRVWNKEITPKSRIMLEAFASYTETAKGRRDAAEEKLVSDTVRQNTSEE